METAELLDGLQNNDRRSIARAITVVENDLPGSFELLSGLPSSSVPVTGITGPPGSGKSTLINALVDDLIRRTGDHGRPFRVAVLAVDPTSPFNHGSLLGDRLRMSEHFNNPAVFIRSLATRGALGGLSAKTIEVLDVIRSAGFDHVIVETVGVGQSEIEIVSMADTTIVVLVPEAGDEIQALKSGIMEIADAFVVNKSDREGADKFAAGLVKTLHERPAGLEVPVFRTIAVRSEGTGRVADFMIAHGSSLSAEKKLALLTEQAYRLIRQARMHDLTPEAIRKEIAADFNNAQFNLYRYVKSKS